MQWSDLLEVARLVRERAETATFKEALLRTAINRAYFASFGHARQYAEQFLGFQSRSESEDHGRLRAHLKNRRRKGDADRLESLRQWRNECDYSEVLTFDIEQIADNAFIQAERLFVSLAPPGS